VHDQSNVRIDPNRPEIRIHGAVELVEGEARRRDGSICNSKAAVFTAFYSSAVSRDRLSVNVSAIRKSIELRIYFVMPGASAFSKTLSPWV
jgi:hypothetical protein